MEVVTSLSQGRTAAAQCGLFTYKSVPAIFDPPCIICSPTLSVFLTYQKCLCTYAYCNARVAWRRSKLPSSAFLCHCQNLVIAPRKVGDF